MAWTYFTSNVFQFFVLACADSISPSPVPVKPPRAKAQTASRGRVSHRVAKRLSNGPFEDRDSRAAIRSHTPRWKSRGTSGFTFHNANFFFRSSSIIHRAFLLGKTLFFFRP